MTPAVSTLLAFEGIAAVLMCGALAYAARRTWAVKPRRSRALAVVLIGASVVFGVVALLVGLHLLEAG